MPTNTELAKLLIPPKWREQFELTELQEESREWKITLTEKEQCVPATLQTKKYSLNGFMNPVEVIDFPLRGKLVYLLFIRRRWKEPGSNKSHFNTYELHPRGMKATKEFGDFLKELDRTELDQLCLAWPDIQHCW